MTAMVVCPEPPAAAIGGAILARGGNAADAAIAAAFAQGVTNPFLCGLSGTAILMQRDRDGSHTVLNGECEIGSAPVPPRWIEGLQGRSEMIGRFIIAGEDNQAGAGSVMVPGFVAACAELWRRKSSGRLGWAELIEPSIRLARDGFEIYPYIADAWALGADGQVQSRPGYPSLAAKLDRDKHARAIYLKDGALPYRVGDRLRQQAYGETLDQLARAGADDFYSGTIGRAMAEDLERRGALIRPSDIAGYRVVEQQALHGTHRGYDVYTTPPPSPGVQGLEMLAILERLGFASLSWGSPESVDMLAQVLRAGFIDNRDIKAVRLGETAAWADRMAAPERSDAWAARIRGGARVDGAAAGPSTGTTHVVVVDDDGAAVSFTHSIGSVAGSGSVTPGLGFLHNNFLGHFDPRPGRAMSIEPGRRIGSGMPTIVCRNGRIELVIGAPGGSRIISAILQVLVHVMDHRMPIDRAVAMPRVHSEEAVLVHLEPGWPQTLADALAALGCTVRSNTYQARVQAIAIGPDGTPVPGLDPRGGAVGPEPAMPNLTQKNP